MIDAQLLDEAIEESGIRLSFLIDKLGISKSAYYKKKSGQIKWRGSEIYVVQHILNLPDEKTNEIFYPKSTL